MSEDQSSAVLVGPDAEQHPDDCPGEDGRADQQAELGVVEPQLRLDLDADDGEDRPDGEADGEGDRRQPEGAALVTSVHVCRALHGGRPILSSSASLSASEYPGQRRPIIDVDQR
jgi:hypothetical protein